ncbi:hypothetical protein PIROE2DRAFT_15895 [Piromyces sp. E2]|nr:hypothetical protein PIROE2DRAFT_15895 [Piromyces sp. E2]|eukprot:OUM58741.1 hypothetical protein PIROE2DRAFT_15895 [Piromyces sp. E2]
MKLITILFTILFASLTSWNLANAKCIIKKKKQEPITLNKYVEVDGKKMSYGVYGEKNEQTIVFLSGLNIISPIINYKPLAEALSDDFKVIIVEHFGHGYSDVSKNQRTIDNIAKEVHALVQKLGLKNIYISGHSLGGLYALYYADKYPENVVGFIGLDNSTLDGEEALVGYDTLIAEKVECNKLFKNNTWSGNSELAIKTKKKTVDKLMSLKGIYYDYTEKDEKILETIFENSYCNDNFVGEYTNIFDNYEATKGKKIPKSIPSLQILSSETCEQYDDWLQMHKDKIYESPLNEIVILETGHNIMFYKKQEVVDLIKNWVKKLNNNK